MAALKNLGNGDSLNKKNVLILAVIFSALIFISALMQTTFLSLFGKVPALTFSICCAIGFIMGGRAGAVSGVFAGICADYLGSTGISFSPIFYMLCAYLCGELVGWFLSKNLPSFLVYSLILGLFKEIVTLIYCGMISESFDLWKITVTLLIPEYFAYLVCVIPAYGAVFGINKLFKGKKKRDKLSFR